MGARERLLDLGVRNDAMLVKVDEQHLARLQAPLGDDLLLRDRQHAHFRGEHHEIIVGDEVASGSEPVAIEGRRRFDARR